jgi:hypothetical protein
LARALRREVGHPEPVAGAHADVRRSATRYWSGCSSSSPAAPRCRTSPTR